MQVVQPIPMKKGNEYKYVLKHISTKKLKSDRQFIYFGKTCFNITQLLLNVGIL